MTDAERRKLIDKLNKETEEFIKEKIEKNKSYKYDDGFTDENIDEILATHPAFMKTQPTAEEIENNPLLKGLQQIQYDPDDTPYEKAMAHKKDGNFQFKFKKYKLACAAYTEAIKSKCDDAELLSILYSNRAAANFHLKNYRSSLLDAMQAVKLYPQKIKALLRCAQCCEKLKRFDDAIDWCTVILSLENDNKLALEIVNNSKKLKQIQARNQRKAALLKQKEDEREKRLQSAIKLRHICFEQTGRESDLDLENTDSQLSKGLRKVYLNENDVLVWPVLLMYPEFETTDFIEHFQENVAFEDLLQNVFSEQAAWDLNHHYVVSQLVVFYENKETKTLYQVPLSKTLGEMLSHETYIVQASTPNFYVLSQSSDFYKSFLSKWKKIELRKFC